MGLVRRQGRDGFAAVACSETGPGRLCCGGLFGDKAGTALLRGVPLGRWGCWFGAGDDDDLTEWDGPVVLEGGGGAGAAEDAGEIGEVGSGGSGEVSGDEEFDAGW